MTEILPFKGIHYNLEKVEDLSRVIAPPYDVIRDEQGKALLGRSPYSVLNLTLGNILPGITDQQKDPYKEAANTFKKWRDQSVLLKDKEPGIYAYYLSYKLKTPEGIVEKTRKGFVALIRLSPYSQGKVLPHERTLAGPKEDRFKLLKSTRVLMSQVFMLYEDPEHKVYDVLDRAIENERPMQCEDDMSVIHKLWPVHDEKLISSVAEIMSDKTLYIADGHHRYETSLAFQDYMHKQMPLYENGADKIMVYLTSTDDPGLSILPYHRLIHSLPKNRLRSLKKKLGEHFEVQPTMLNPMEPGQNRRDFMKSLSDIGQTQLGFGLVERDSGNAYFLTPKPEAMKQTGAESSLESLLAGMDVVVLEDLILSGMLGISRKALLDGKHVRYETDSDAILDQLKEPENQLAFLLNPIPLGLVTRIARGRGIMPEKSTYFFPKVVTGLVMNEMD